MPRSGGGSAIGLKAPCGIAWSGLARKAAQLARPSEYSASQVTVEYTQAELCSQLPVDPDVELPLHVHWNAELAAAKSMAYLMRMEYIGYLGPEKNSVYGAAVAIPQVARSAGWPVTLTGLAIRAYVFLVLNLFLQFFLIGVVNEELNVMNAFAARPHLCDYGAHNPRCPHGPNCKGPTGSAFSPSKNHPFQQWNTRIFFRDAVKNLFPDRAGDIDDTVDPGEWGLEDYNCRLLCAFIFVLGLADDLRQTFKLLSLVLHVPTAPEPWIKFEVPAWEDKETAKKVHSWTEFELVKYQVAGMPLVWKIVNIVFVFLPKCWIWWTFASCGFMFIMETPGIIELVLNSMAMTFILGLDELIFGCLATIASKHIMDSLEDMALFSDPEEEHESPEETILRFQREEFGHHRLKLLWLVFPKRLVLLLGVLVFFICKYYWENCTRAEDGSWVSKPVYIPVEVPYNPLSFIYGVSLEWAKEPMWPLRSLVKDDGD